MVEQDGLERLLRDAVVALSLTAQQQCQVTEPGCVSCELLNDFDHACSSYMHSCSARLTAQQTEILQRINQTMDTMTEEDYVCFESSVLHRPVWAELRHLARHALPLFGWQSHLLSPHQEIEPGVWKRPDDES